MNWRVELAQTESYLSATRSQPSCSNSVKASLIAKIEGRNCEVEREIRAKTRSMTKEERSVLEAVDKIVQSEKVRAKILPIAERVRADLARKPGALMTWEPVALETFGAIAAGDPLRLGFYPSRGLRYRSGTPSQQSSTHDVVRSDRRLANRRNIGRAHRPNRIGDRLAIEHFSERPQSAFGTALGFNSAKHLASPGDTERRGLGSGLFSHRARRRINRRAAGRETNVLRKREPELIRARVGRFVFRGREPRRFQRKGIPQFE